jgi:hypothetical protein
MYNSAKQGWYKVLNAKKFIMQTNESKSVMNSVRINEGNLEINFKSSLELKAIKYFDMNKFVNKFSLDPFAIKYYKPTTGKFHRYFVDFFVEFENNQKFLVEIKSSGETVEPKKPSKKTQKAILNYQKAYQTWLVNSAKWKACEEFCKEKGMKFIILTEKELK